MKPLLLLLGLCVMGCQSPPKRVFTEIPTYIEHPQITVYHICQTADDLEVYNFTNMVDPERISATKDTFKFHYRYSVPTDVVWDSIFITCPSGLDTLIVLQGGDLLQFDLETIINHEEES